MKTFDHSEDSIRLDFLDELLHNEDVIDIQTRENSFNGLKTIKVFTIMSQHLVFEQGVSIRNIIDQLMQFKLKHNIRI